LQEGFGLYKQTIVRQQDAALERRKIESHYSYSVAHSVEFHEIFPAGEPITIMPPAVIGKGNHRSLNGTTRSFYVTCLEEARVRGRSAVTEVSELALADFQGQELARIDDDVEFDSGVFHRDGDKIWLISDARPALKLDQAFSLLGARTDFFGDWFVDYIVRYVAATMSGHVPRVPVLIDMSMPPTHRQALEAMLIPGTEIIEVPAFQGVEVKRLWQAPSIIYMPFHRQFNEKFKWDDLAGRPERSLLVEDEMVRRVTLVLGPGCGPSRVFLARKEFRHRKMTNHREIEAIAAAHGFVISYPEDLDFVSQAKLLRDARFVVGPEGSALALCCFVGRGAKICVLHQEEEGLVLYNNCLPLKEIHLTVITGPDTGDHDPRKDDRNYRIDAEAFRCFLDEWCGPPVQT
jgi:Glycosyltransferase 61